MDGVLSIIVAVASNDVIGADNDMPWDLPADLRHFKKTTTGHVVIMGRRTYESIGRPLPNRHNIVLALPEENFAADGIHVMHSLEEAIDEAKRRTPGAEVFVMGGGSVYRQAMGHVDRIRRTAIHASIEGDITFPTIDETVWERVSADEHPAESGRPALTFEVWERRVTAATE
jgi:dihydrofolate reductase